MSDTVLEVDIAVGDKREESRDRLSQLRGFIISVAQTAPHTGSFAKIWKPLPLN